VSKITVIIPSLAEKDKDYLKVCVESLRATVDWDIIVVTNGGKDMNPIADLDIKGITKHLHTKQQGQCNAVNRGVEAAEGDCEWIFISNADMYYAPGWNRNLRFDDLCFSPNLVEPTNNNGSAQPFLKLDAGFTLDEFDKEKVDEFIKEDQIDAITSEPGFNFPFFMRMDVWRTIGGYDEKYDPWGSNSDTDLQTLVNIAGIIPKRYRDVLVYHFSNKSGTFDGTHQEEWQRNFDHYRIKFGYTRDDEPKADVWYNKNMVLEDKLIFHPDWEGKYLEMSNNG
jgi:glycosyltransferase involved in cell wall biosynthesis